MIGIDKLAEKPGVIAAGQFDEAGKIIRAAGDRDEAMKNVSAEIADGITKSIVEQIKGRFKIGGKTEDSLQGWAFWTGNHAFCAVGRTGVIVESSKVDFNRLLVDLLGEEPSGPAPMNH